MNSSSPASSIPKSMLALFIAMILLPLFVAFFNWPIELHGADYLVAGFIIVGWSAWILMTFYVYFDAQRRGSNAVLWALFVFFGQVLGFIVYLLMRNATFKLNSNGAAKCPHCQKPRREDFTVCPYCRTTLQTLCSHCNRALETDWQVCPYCRQETAAR